MDLFDSNFDGNVTPDEALNEFILMNQNLSEIEKSEREFDDDFDGFDEFDDDYIAIKNQNVTDNEAKTESKNEDEEAKPLSPNVFFSLKRKYSILTLAIICLAISGIIIMLGFTTMLKGNVLGAVIVAVGIFAGIGVFSANIKNNIAKTKKIDEQFYRFASTQDIKEYKRIKITRMIAWIIIFCTIALCVFSANYKRIERFFAQKTDYNYSSSYSTHYNYGIVTKSTTKPLDQSTKKHYSSYENKSSYDDLNAKDYHFAEDFYEDHYDDFADFEEAEDYFDENQ